MTTRTSLQAKEQRLLYEVKAELGRGNRSHIYAVYTRKRDVTRRLERILRNEGISAAVLSADVPTDLLDFPTIIFYESGYSLHTLRQASRRSWRIGQRRPVRVKFLCSEMLQVVARNWSDKTLSRRAASLYRGFLPK